jgi:hypothetical protein
MTTGQNLLDGRTVEQFNLSDCQRIATENTILHGVLETFLYRRNEFLRNVTTLNLSTNCSPPSLSLIHRTNINNDVGELTTTTTLLLVNLTQIDSLE